MVNKVRHLCICVIARLLIYIGCVELRSSMLKYMRELGKNEV